MFQSKKWREEFADECVQQHRDWGFMDYYEMANMIADFSEEEKKKYDKVLELDKDIYGI